MYMKQSTAQKISIVYVIAMVIFWFCIFALKGTTGKFNYLFSFLIALLPFAGGMIAIYNSKPELGLRGFLSKGIFFLGLGLLCWGFGELIWSYYNFVLHVSAPYPSWADLGFAPSVFFYCVGVIYLARAAGADLGLQRKFAKFFIIAAPVIMFALSYYLLVVIAREGILYTSGDPILKSILDIAYPLGDFISLTVAIVISGLSFKSLMPEYKTAIVSLLVGLSVMFAADLMFSYTTTRLTYYNGNFGDLLFVIALFFLTFGALGFSNSQDDAKVAA